MGETSRGKTMTIDERARKIAEEYCEGEFTEEKYERFIPFLAAELRAVREEVLQQLMSKTELYRNGLLRAAEIAEIGKNDSPDCRWVAERIRKEAGEL